VVPFRSDFSSTSATPGSLAPFGAPASSTAPAASGFADVLQTLSRQGRAGDADPLAADAASASGAADPHHAPGAPANSAGETSSDPSADVAPCSPGSRSRSARHNHSRGKNGSAAATSGVAENTASRNNAAIAALPGDHNGKGRQQKTEKNDKPESRESNDKADATGATASVPPAIVTDFTQAPKNLPFGWSMLVSTPANPAASAAITATAESTGAPTSTTSTTSPTSANSTASDSNAGRAAGSKTSVPAAATPKIPGKSSSPAATQNTSSPLDTIDIAGSALESATDAGPETRANSDVVQTVDTSSVTSAIDRSKAGRSQWATTPATQPDLKKAATLAAIAQLGAGFDPNAGDSSAAASDSLATLLGNANAQTSSTEEPGQTLADLIGAAATTGKNQNPASNAAIARALASATNGWSSSTSVTNSADVLKSPSGAPALPLNADALRAAADRAAASLTSSTSLASLPGGIGTAPMPDLLSAAARAFAPQAPDGTAALPLEAETTSAVSQIVQSMRVQALAGGGEAHIALDPGYLGGVTVTVRVDHDGVTASVAADTPAVREALRSQESTLRQTLSDQGLRLDRFEVTEPSQTPRRNPNGGDRQTADEQSRPRSQKRRDPSAPAFEFVA
jgi:flagellar hook-length control protein FliK